MSKRRGENDLSKSCFLFDLTLLNIGKADRSKMSPDRMQCEYPNPSKYPQDYVGI